MAQRLRTHIGFRSLSTQNEIAFWAQSRVEDVLRARGVRRIVVDDPDRSYIPPLNWANTPEQLALMQAFPASKLTIIERIGSGEDQPPLQ